VILLAVITHISAINAGSIWDVYASLTNNLEVSQNGRFPDIWCQAGAGQCYPLTKARSGSSGACEVVSPRGITL